MKNYVAGFFCLVGFYTQRENAAEGTPPSGLTFHTKAKLAINTFKFQPPTVANDYKYLCLNNSKI